MIKFTKIRLFKITDMFKVRLEACNFVKKETLVPVFSCEFCVISKNTFFTEHLRETSDQ